MDKMDLKQVWACWGLLKRADMWEFAAIEAVSVVLRLEEGKGLRCRVKKLLRGTLTHQNKEFGKGKL